MRLCELWRAPSRLKERRRSCERDIGERLADRVALNAGRVSSNRVRVIPHEAIAMRQPGPFSGTPAPASSEELHEGVEVEADSVQVPALREDLGYRISGLQLASARFL